MEFQIGMYKDQVFCDIMSMDVYHVLLVKPWKFDRGVTYDGRGNNFTFEKYGTNHTLLSFNEEKPKAQDSCQLEFTSTTCS